MNTNIFPILLLCATLPAAAQSQDLTYMRRNGGAFREGIRPTPSTGPLLTLIAAMIDYSEPDQGLPRQFRAGFYLPNGQDAPDLTIREVTAPRYNYWLGELNRQWQPGSMNEFAWETDTVVRKLNWDDALKLSDLGAAVRLGRTALASAREDVVPVALYSGGPPTSADAYRFVFLSNQSMRIQYDVLSEAGQGQLQGALPTLNVMAGSPQAIRWKMSGQQPDGWYLLRINGYATSNNERLSHTVRFYHARRLGK